MRTPSVLLTIQSVEFENGKARVLWSLEADGPTRLNVLPFELQFHGNGTAASGRFGPLDDPDGTIRKCAVFVFLSVALPLLSMDHRSITTICPWQWTDSDKTYWQSTLRRLGFDPGAHRFFGREPAFCLRYQEQGKSPLSLALFYGGGIESNAALTALLPYRPTLFIVEGPNWMNNNSNGELSVKRKLERDVTQKHELDVVYARMNIRDITSAVSDALLNHFCTGGLFYWCAAGAGLAIGIPIFLIAQELEYTLIRERFDKSLTPHHLFWGHHGEAPLLIPILGWSPSIELLDLLRESPLLDSLYSCFYNTEHRWCGQCTKCYRVFEWARRLGIDPARFGMFKPAAGTAEGSQLYRLHWQTASQLYPEPGKSAAKANLIGLTDVALIDLVHIGLYDCMGGRVEFQAGEMTVYPAGDTLAEVHFHALELRGVDEFACRVISRGGSWSLSFELQDACGEPVTAWARTLHGRAAGDLGQRLPELFGRHTLVLRVQGLVSATAEQDLPTPPTLLLPTLRRGETR